MRGMEAATAMETVTQAVQRLSQKAEQVAAGCDAVLDRVQPGVKDKIERMNGEVPTSGHLAHTLQDLSRHLDRADEALNVVLTRL